MTKTIDTPETVADMIVLLRTLPANAQLMCFVVEDSSTLSEMPAYKIKINSYPDVTFLTFSNGYAISKE